jgi:hypothetical protein
MGHEEKSCRTLELMKEINLDSYMVKYEFIEGHIVPQFRNDQQFQVVP